MKKLSIVIYMAIIVVMFGCFKCKANSGIFDCNISSPKSVEQKKMFDYKKTILENGLTVITVEDFSCPIIAVQIWYNVGSKDEDPNRQGFAHMFEHMMFRGTELIGPEEHFSLIRSVGGTTNGYTSFDRTVYLETVPSDQLDLALWLEAQRMAFLSITAEDFQTERKIVEEELRMRLNEPYGTVYEKILDGIFSKSSYRWPPIGQISHLRASTVGELRSFWKNYYGPNNAVLIIVGAIEHNKAVELAKTYFQWIKPESIVYRPFIKDVSIDEQKTITITGEKAPAPIVAIGYRTVSLSNPDSVRLDLLANILGSGHSSRLYKILVDDTRLAVSAEAESYSLKNDGIFGIGAVVNPVNPKIDEVIEILKRQIIDIKNNGVSEDELIKAKNQYLKGLIVQNLSIENKARLLGMATLDVGDTEYVNTILADAQSITAEQLKQTAIKYFNDSMLYTIIIEQNIKDQVVSINSGQENAPIVADDVNDRMQSRSARPDYFPTKPPVKVISNPKLKPQVCRQTMSNGMKIIVVPNNEVPFVSMFLGFDAGAWADEQNGQCNMTIKLLPTATKSMSADKLANLLDKSAISVNSGADLDNSSISIDCLKDYADMTAKLLADFVIEPAFDSNEFEKLQKNILTSAEIQMQSPEFLVESQFSKILFSNHPYSRTPEGLPDEIKNLSAKSCSDFWDRHFSPDKTVLIVAGDITAKEAIALGEKYFTKWQKKQVPAFDFPNPKLIKGTKIYLYDTPQSPQSRIIAGHLAITRQEQPQFFYSRVVSDYFGLGFNSRLNKSLRVEKGLTYGAFGGYFADKYAGKFFVSTFTKTQSTVQAVRAIIEEVKKLADISPQADELSQSKSYLLGSFILHRQTPQEIARDLWLIESQNLGIDYLDNLLKETATVTIKDCENFVKQTLNPDDLQIVVVGDGEKLKSQLEQIAPVEIIETKNPVK